MLWIAKWKVKQFKKLMIMGKYKKGTSIGSKGPICSYLSSKKHLNRKLPISIV